MSTAVDELVDNGPGLGRLGGDRLGGFVAEAEPLAAHGIAFAGFMGMGRDELGARHEARPLACEADEVVAVRAPTVKEND